MMVTVICRQCGGTGKMGGTKWFKRQKNCPWCHGTGKKTMKPLQDFK